MKLKLAYLMLIAIAFVSCKKTTEVEMSLSNSGKLTYKLTDANGKGLSNVKISLFDHLDSYYASNSILIDERRTDGNGQVDFGDLNPKSYLIVADSAKVNNVNYTVRDYVQVTTGMTKNKETKVTDFSGTLVVKVTSYNTNQPAKNIGVLIIPFNNYEYEQYISKNLANAEFKGVTGENGIATLKIASGKDYVVLLYNITTLSNLNWGTTSIQKGMTMNYFAGFYQ
ncbi:hypothetical protein BV902_18000 [Sphingobacterium sp. B29]|uniref:hypothetical protein n=1 Tax=Sphingobacterium sp. B29 TaxID=1933220 RepID=UPI000958116C|nr:hypothetical protein [Sphingobacterium sp. B29]APU97997.1 hypothetical protein BV902_18000 [Sphingobacterium sp. B29]